MGPQLPTPAMDFCGFDTSCYAYMFYNWQTLIGGLVAIGAALYAGGWVRRQILASERIERDRIARREKAARAVLPLTLTKFIDFAEECASILQDIGKSGIPRASIGGSPLAAPQIPQQAISDLERAIEATSCAVTADIMTNLAGHTQVLHSSIGDLVAKVNARGSALYARDPNTPAWEIRTARVHAAASRLFSWARGQAEVPEDVTWDHIEQSMSLLNVGDEKTLEMVNRKREAGAHPLAW